MVDFGRDLYRFSKHRLAAMGSIMIFFAACAGLLAPLIAPHDPSVSDLTKSLVRPSEDFPLGTDLLGRCLLSQILYGARITLGVSFIVALTTAIIGLVAGMLCGYFGGVIDELIMRLVDMMLALPAIILALVIVGSLGPGMANMMLAMLITGWTGYARVTRSVVLPLRVSGFVESARATGASHWYVLRVHILPNALSPVVIMATFGMGQAILAISALSFLGLGAQPPQFDWGSMLKDGIVHMRSTPRLVVFPGMAIMMCVLAFNFVGDGLREVLTIRYSHKEEV